MKNISFIVQVGIARKDPRNQDYGVRTVFIAKFMFENDMV
jgi:hypothetical protein